MLKRLSSLVWACITLAAVAILAPAALCAPPSNHQLQQLIRDTSSQFELAYRFRPAEAHVRQAELQAVISAWRAAPHSEANDERLTAWLRSAIRASMPGSREALPPMPRFQGLTKVEQPKVDKARTKTDTTAVATQHPAETLPANVNHDKPDPAVEAPIAKTSDELTDPFVDDPIEAEE